MHMQVWNKNKSICLSYWRCCTMAFVILQISSFCYNLPFVFVVNEIPINDIMFRIHIFPEQTTTTCTVTHVLAEKQQQLLPESIRLDIHVHEPQTSSGNSANSMTEAETDINMINISSCGNISNCSDLSNILPYKVLSV